MQNDKYESQELSHNGEDIHPLSPTKPTPLTYAVGACSDPGKRKKLNEDSIFAVRSAWGMHTSSLPFGLFVVADGMGGYADGQDAACGAIQAMVDCLLPTIVRSNALEPGAYTALLGDAMQRANEAVHQQNSNLQNREGADVDVGVLTTVTAAMTVGSTAYVANVGNCRTYLYRLSEGLKQITTDHSVVARLVQDGILTPEDVYTHLQRHQVYRALFDQPFVEVDLFTVPLHLGDTLLLCSDGLWNMVRDPQIEGVLSNAPPDPSQAAEVLIQAALDEGGKDNVSVIVVSMIEAQNQAIVPEVQVFVKPARVQMPQV